MSGPDRLPTPSALRLRPSRDCCCATSGDADERICSPHTDRALRHHHHHTRFDHWPYPLSLSSSNTAPQMPLDQCTLTPTSPLSIHHCSLCAKSASESPIGPSSDVTLINDGWGEFEGRLRILQAGSEVQSAMIGPDHATTTTTGQSGPCGNSRRRCRHLHSTVLKFIK